MHFAAPSIRRSGLCMPGHGGCFRRVGGDRATDRRSPNVLCRTGPDYFRLLGSKSLKGAPQELIIYVAVSIVLLAVFYSQFARRFRSIGLIAVASFVFTLFVVFKAAFVRNDGHALIAAGALLLAGYCVSAMTKSVLSLMVWTLVALVGLISIPHTQGSTSRWHPKESMTRLGTLIKG
jgi:hypothetical protein